jgi:hypothetical protein
VALGKREEGTLWLPRYKEARERRERREGMGRGGKGWSELPLETFRALGRNQRGERVG